MSTDLPLHNTATSNVLARRPWRFLRWRKRLVFLPILLVGIVLVLYPVLSFLALAFWPDLFHQGTGGFSLHSFMQAFTGYDFQALCNSLWVGLSVSLLATSMGIWLAWISTRTQLFGRRAIAIAIWGVLLLPSYFSALGWQMLLSPGGLLPQGFLAHWILGPLGVVLVLSLKQVLLAYLPMLAAWRMLPAQLDEAARVFELPRHIRIWLILRALSPGIIGALTLTYANALQDFGVAATLAAGVNMPLATYAIFQSVSTQPIYFSVGAAQSWLLLCLLLPALWLQAHISRRARRYTVFSGRANRAALKKLRFWSASAHSAGVSLFFFLALGVPLLAALVTSLQKNPDAGFIARNMSLSRYAHLLFSPNLWGPLRYSISMGSLGGFFAVSIGLAVALLVLEGRFSGRIWDALLLMILALPSVVLGSGYIFAYNQPWLPLYGGSLLLGMAYVAITMPYGVRMLLGPVGLLHHSLGEAARIHGLGRFQVWQHIRLPLLAWPLIFTFLLLAVEAIFELPATELLYPANVTPIPVAIMQAATAGDFGMEATLQILSIIVVGTLFILLYLLARRFLPQSWQSLQKESH
ncbi:ABC transporter permease [Acidithiobacillus concretivorus]|uniref:Iron ABC transporter permease n=1 Tax=Acidithiobacillus concretivorus TaxID=3063952 RepID=A0ABS5ZLM3_9PROT|nr:iron ABC transporter permease [Acidithiobacillus concretivorus]